MDIKKIRKIVGWCAVINYGLLILVVIFFLFGRDRAYDFNQLFFPVSVEIYDAIVLMTLAIWEVLIWVFTIVPYVVLRIVDKK
jgi:hypothetical protein